MAGPEVVAPVTALDFALGDARRAAIVALGKRYVRSTDEPDPDEYRAEFKALGFNDEVAVEFLLVGWRILRETGAEAPAETKPTPEQPTAETEPATDKQWGFIRQLCREKNLAEPDTSLTKATASTVIEQLQAGTYKPEEWAVPF